MSPEALGEAECDGRADQFSWGVTAYEVLTGVHPRGGKADPIALDTPRLVSELVPEVPFPVAAAVARTLIGERTERFDDMGALIAALDRAMAREPEPPPTEQAPATADGGQPTRLEGSAATVREPTFNDSTDPSGRPPVMTRRSDELYGVSEMTKQSATPSGRRRTAPAGPGTPAESAAEGAAVDRPVPRGSHEARRLRHDDQDHQDLGVRTQEAVRSAAMDFTRHRARRGRCRPRRGRRLRRAQQRPEKPPAPFRSN